jgi:hypothetical protein
VLREAARILAEPAESAASVAAAIRLVDAVYPLVARKRAGKPVENDSRVWMELIDEVEREAMEVADGLPLRHATGTLWAGKWPEYAPQVSRSIYQRSIEAALAVRAALKQSGRRRGRTPAKWPVYFRMVAEAGLAANVKGPENLKRLWMKARAE